MQSWQFFLLLAAIYVAPDLPRVMRPVLSVVFVVAALHAIAKLESAG